LLLMPDPEDGACPASDEVSAGGHEWHGTPGKTRRQTAANLRRATVTRPARSARSDREFRPGFWLIVERIGRSNA
jgi:hypothetical protein